MTTENEGKTAQGRLEEFLDSERLTQTALSEKCDVSPQYVNNIVRRGQRITQDFAENLHEETDINLNWLFSGEGSMYRNGDEGEDEETEQSVCPFIPLLEKMDKIADVLEETHKPMKFEVGPK